MKPIKTEDNSITFYNEEVKDHYHTKSGAREEAFEKHAKVLGVDSVKNSRIFDICFGMGYNTSAALDLIKGNVIIYCFENDREILKKILEIGADFKSYGLIKEFVKYFLYENNNEFVKDNVKLIMMFGDARKMINEINEKADFVFFDPFSPAKVPEMWTKEFLSDIFDKMKENGKLSTYSCAKFVRDNLKESGFEIKDGPIIGRRSPSTIATKQKC